MLLRGPEFVTMCLTIAIATTSTGCGSAHGWAPVTLAGPQEGASVDVAARRENYAGEWSKRCALRHWGQATLETIDDANLPPGTLAVAICDDVGEPQPGITLMINTDAGKRVELSGEDGELRFNNLPAGTHKVEMYFFDTLITRTITLPTRNGVAFAFAPKFDINRSPEDGPTHACRKSQRVLSGHVADANFAFLVRSATYPGTVANEAAVVTPRPIAQLPQPIEFTIIDEPMVWAEHFRGFKVRMTNISDADINLTARDGNIYIVQQARDRAGNWRNLEYQPGSFCGNSYASWVFRAGSAWEFIAPRFKGRFTTELRFAFVDTNARYADPAIAAQHPLTVMYSPTFIGSINDSQFTRRRPQYRYRKGVVNRYAEID